MNNSSSNNIYSNILSDTAEHYIYNTSTSNINSLIDYPININNNNNSIINSSLYSIIDNLVTPSTSLDEVFNSIISYLSIDIESRKIVEKHLTNYLKKNTKFDIVKGLLKNNSDTFENLVNNLLIFIAFTRKDNNIYNLIQNIQKIRTSFNDYSDNIYLKNYISHTNNLKDEVNKIEKIIKKRRIELNDIQETILKDIQKVSSNNKCPICVTNIKTHIVIPCGHKCICEECSKQIVDINNVCPLCGQEIKGIYKVYDS